MKIKLIRSKDELAPFVRPLKAAPYIALDTETTGLDPRAGRLRLVQLAASGLPVLLIDCDSFLPDGRELLIELLGSKAVKVLHNAKFDLQFLMAHNIPVEPVFDTMLAAQLLRPCGGPGRAGLAALAAHYLHIELDKGEQKGDWSGALSEAQLAYAARDAGILLRLREIVEGELRRNDLTRIARIEFDCARALAHVEYHGIRLDREQWAALTRRAERERDAALEALYAYTGPPVRQTTMWGVDEVQDLNLDSNAYVLGLLRRHGIPAQATSKHDLFPYMDQPLVRTLSAYRRASKSLGSFLYPIGHMVSHSTSRLHPRYHQISAWSGRMSCDSPNIQQIPREAAFRACFVAPRGRKLVIADYSQIELRVAAEIAGDERMIRAYREGQDLHLLTASLILNKPMKDVTKAERQAAKAVNFGLIFGMGAAGLRQYAEQTYGAPMMPDQAARFHRRYFEAYAGIRRWHQSLKSAPPGQARTLTGRKFAYPENPSLPITTNSPVQGTAADITKLALGMLVRRVPDDVRIIAVVHDEILMECPADRAKDTAALLKDTMEQAGNAVLSSVPCVADAAVADSWAEK